MLSKQLRKFPRPTEDIEDDGDLLGTGKNGRSSSARQSPYFTQPTQLVNEPSVKPRSTIDLTDEDPLTSDVEVPVSSPFRQSSAVQLKPKASLMAPRGTEYHPPRPIRAPTTASTTLPRPKAPPKSYESSSDDNRPARNSSLSGYPNKRAKLVDDVFNRNAGKFSREKCEKALTLFGNDVHQASRHLWHPRVFAEDYNMPDSRYSPVEKYIPAGWKDDPIEIPGSDSESDDSLPPLDKLAAQKKTCHSQPVAKQATIKNFVAANSLAQDAPPRPKRRLIKGRRHRESSPVEVVEVKPRVNSSDVKPPGVNPRQFGQPTTPQKVAALKRPAGRQPGPEIVDLLSDNEDAEFSASDPPMPASGGSDQEADVEDRVLKYINDCNSIQLMAVTKMKEPRVKALLSHQPFKSIEAARRVSIPCAKKAGKTAKISIGEDVVDAVMTYLQTLDKIDKCIQECEKRAGTVRAVTSKWKLDSIGESREPGSPATLGSQSTPGSWRTKAALQDLPLPSEPALMRGHCVMKSYQLYGLNWMNQLYQWKYGGILADDMGLGKTCQVISLICSLVQSWQGDPNATEDSQGRIRPWPNLIVVPPSTLQNWQNEFEKFAPDLKVTCYAGSQVERAMIGDDILDDTSEHHVILTTYTQIGKKEDIHYLRKMRPVVAVFDEGHKLKNPKTKQYKDLAQIDVQWRLLLTGTPVQNNVMEMIGLLSFIQPNLFKRHEEVLEALFDQKFSVADLSKGVGLHTDRVARARTILEPFILQRRKEQVLKDLPQKFRKVVYCEMDKEQKSVYAEYQKRYLDQAAARQAGIAAPAATKKSARSNDENNVWMQLRKAAVHPLLFRKIYDDKTCDKMAQILLRTVSTEELRQENPVHMSQELKNCSDFQLHLWCRDYSKQIGKFGLPDRQWLKCGKVKELMRLLREYKKSGERALVFTKFATVIEILSECMQSEGIDYCALQGATDVSDRQELIDEFTADPSKTVFLLTTGAGGTGINLTAANKVIIFDMSDNPQDDMQAENRAHRIGQTREVEIIRLVSKNTVEEIIYTACQKKLELADKVTGWETGAVEPSVMEAEVREALEKRGEGYLDADREPSTSASSKAGDNTFDSDDEPLTATSATTPSDGTAASTPRPSRAASKTKGSPGGMKRKQPENVFGASSASPRKQKRPRKAAV